MGSTVVQYHGRQNKEVLMRKKWFFTIIIFALIGRVVMAEGINLDGIRHGDYS